MAFIVSFVDWTNYLVGTIIIAWICKSYDYILCRMAVMRAVVLPLPALNFSIVSKPSDIKDTALFWIGRREWYKEWKIGGDCKGDLV